MKRSYIYLVFAALALLVGSCAKDDTQSFEGGGAGLTPDGLIVLSVATGAEEEEVEAHDSTRIIATENTDILGYSLSWQNDSEKVDSFTVYNSDTGARMGNFEYIGEHGAKRGDFVQASDFAMPYGNYTAVYPASTLSTLSARNTAIANEISRTQSVINPDELGDNLVMKSEFVYSAAEPIISFSFAQEYAYVKFQYTVESGFSPTHMEFWDGNSYRYRINAANSKFDSATNTYESIIKVNANSEANRRLYFYVNNSEDRFDNSDPSATKYHHLIKSDAPDFVGGKIYNLTFDLDTYNNWIPVYDLDDLEDIYHDVKANYQLMNDIDCNNASSSGFTSGTDFEGILAGGELGTEERKTISNLNLTGSFFLITENVHIYNINVVDVRFQQKYETDSSGIFISRGSFVIENCTISASDKTSGYVRGLGKSGINNDDIGDYIESAAGAFVGSVVSFDNKNSILYNCHNYVDVNTHDNYTASNVYVSGGLIGNIGKNSAGNCYIIGCSNHGDVKGTHNVGGLVGSISCQFTDDASLVILGSQNMGKVYASEDYAGGIIGAINDDDMESVNLYMIGVHGGNSNNIYSKNENTRGNTVGYINPDASKFKYYFRGIFGDYRIPKEAGYTGTGRDIGNLDSTTTEAASGSVGDIEHIGGVFNDSQFLTNVNNANAELNDPIYGLSRMFSFKINEVTGDNNDTAEVVASGTYEEAMSSFVLPTTMDNQK